MTHRPPHSEDKIGYVCKRYPRFSETFIVNEILAHERAGQEVEIFALRPVQETHFQDIIARVRAPVTRIPEKLRSVSAFWSLVAEAEEAFPGTVNRMLASGGSADELAQALALALQVSARGVTHLHAHFGTLATTVARLAAAIAGIGYSFTAHAKDIYYDYGEDLSFDRKMRDADFVVTVSDYNLQHLRAIHGVDADGLIRIYNGLDLDRFRHAAPRPEATEILAVGRLVEKKGFHILIEALMLLAEQGMTPRCRIVGSGDEAKNLRMQIAGSGLSDHVSLEGPRPQAEVIEAMRSAAVLACPCIVGRDGNRDGLPTVLLEAMALGTPCISTDVTGIPELIRDGQTGLLCPKGDPTALAAALRRMLEAPDLRAEVSASGRALIEQEFDIEQNAMQLRAAIREAQAVRREMHLMGAA